ncbi:MAG TPA: CDP-alcohol phosphatidyltransferase family protein [Chthoniobacterales bacterium]|nr:CDP-alcohol phosphatidyltransferase family protein [Chthoniobacterales bacterium]
MAYSSSAFLILADETASQRVAGLTQLDRLVLGLNELVEAESSDQIVDAIIFWHPNIPSAARWLPRHPRITRIRVTEAVTSLPPDSRVLHTALFIRRGGLADFLAGTTPVTVDSVPVETIEAWNDTAAGFHRAIQTNLRPESWQIVKNAEDVIRCEKLLLSATGKSQDGLVSRFLNRPLSRRLSQFLLHYDLTPTAWTVYAFVLPFLAFLCLAGDGYVGILIGAIIFQIYSIVDGCDGEMARATYQESERGGRVDDFLDMLGSILFVVGLGLGLFRSRSSFYLLEGIICAAVIAINEWSLRRVKIDTAPASEQLRDAMYPRHRRLLAQSGSALLGDKSIWWILQFTKRDVAIFAFMILAMLDQSPWILHLWLAVSAATLILSVRSSKAGISS